jgi:hypothetical protein
MKRFVPVLLSALCLILVAVIAKGALPVVEEILSDVWDSTNHTIQIEMNQSNITGDLAVGDELTVTGAATFSSFLNTPIEAVEAASYTLDADSEATVFAVDYTTTGAVSFILGSDVAVDGRHIIVYDEDGNANTNNITISTEGSETINGAATYTMDADSEAVHLVSDGTNFFVLGGFGE